MDLSAILSKVKELKLAMAQLENMEEKLPENLEEKVEESEAPEMQAMEEKLGVEKEGSEASEKLCDDEILEMFGKKKKPAKKGMMLAVSVGKPKAKASMGKYK